MGRRKGSLNKKNVNMKSKNEVAMTENITQEMELDTVQTELDLARAELEKVKIEIEEKKQELKFAPRREISPEEQKLVDKQISTTNANKSKSEVIERQKEFDNQKVTGRFINRRVPGQPAKLTYMKYAEDPVKWYYFEDGGTYTIPRGFADQINEYYHSPVFIQKQGPQNLTDNVGENSMISEVDRSNKKYAFVPIGFAA